MRAGLEGCVSPAATKFRKPGSKIAIALLLGLVSGSAQAHPSDPALKSEADYLVNSSFTLQAKNRIKVDRTDDAYGALNNVRLGLGPDWVRPGEGAMAIIGLMAASAQLKSSGQDIGRYDAVIDAWFKTWLLGRKHSICFEKDNPQFGGIASRVYYDEDGKLQKPPTEFNTGVTGAVLSALWKHGEYLNKTGRTADAKTWLNGEAFDVASNGGRFLKRCQNTKYNLLSPSPAGGNLWINDTALSVAGLRCLDRWSKTIGKKVTLDDKGTTAAQLADQLATGLNGMKDTGPTKGFFKYLNPADGSRSYGGNLDQLSFVPYETDALPPGEDFAREISNFWTRGAAGKQMTFQINDPKAWTYFGTRWHLYDNPDPTSDRLTPGPGLQLGKAEWKFAQARGDKALRQRALKRLEFATNSNLWLGATGREEAGIPGGIVDWRLASESRDSQTGKAQDWERFIDTSAYFIELTLMLHYGQDTKYIPD